MHVHLAYPQQGIEQNSRPDNDEQAEEPDEKDVDEDTDNDCSHTDSEQQRIARIEPNDEITNSVFGLCNHCFSIVRSIDRAKAFKSNQLSSESQSDGANLAIVLEKEYNGATKTLMEKNKINVLIVDDNAEYAGLLQHTLRSFQGTTFETVVAHNAEEVTGTLAKNPNFDIILMDYYLPDGNGLEITRRISESANPIPIILLTSSKEFRIAIEAMKYGVEEYLLKEEAVDTVLPRTITNVVDRVRIKKKIHHAEHEAMIAEKRAEAIRELVVTMCHEFNNPLAAIKISADILVRQAIAPEHKKLLQELNSSISLLEKQIITLRDMNMDNEKESGAETPGE
jgi:CheY-like chemotaxis protein